MKNINWLKIVLFGILLLYIIRYLIVNIYYKNIFEFSSLYNDARWIDNNLNPKIVFFGSSMTRYSIIPKIISKNSNLENGKVVNLGVDAATPYEIYISYKKNKHKFKKTKVFFFSLEPWIFSIKYYKFKLFEKSLWSKEEWKYYMPNWDMYGKYKNSLIKISIEDIFSKEKKLNIKNLGYAPLHYNKTKFKLATKAEILEYFTDKLHNNIAISEFQLKYLKKLKSEIEKNHAEFIILFVPNHISYTKAIYKYNKKYNEILSSKLNKALGKVKQIGNYCPNYYNLNNKDFFDKYHLEDKGAIKYSTKLGNIIKKIHKAKKRDIIIDYSCIK